MSGNHLQNARRAWRRTLSVPAEPLSAPQVRAFVRELADVAGFSPRAVDEIELAVGEAITNAILYCHGRGSCVRNRALRGSPPILVDVGVDGRVLFVEICDPGPGFDIGDVRDRERPLPDDPGGRGLELMDALMDDVHFHFDGSGTRVRLERLLSRAL